MNEYEKKSYVTELETKLEDFTQKVGQELAKQARRPNRESEKRLRKLLMGFRADVAVPYKKASLADLGTGAGEE